jgi:hypothetical protein
MEEVREQVIWLCYENFLLQGGSSRKTEVPARHGRNEKSSATLDEPQSFSLICSFKNHLIKGVALIFQVSDGWA